MESEGPRDGSTRGCFEVTFDGVPMDLRKSLLGSIDKLFKLPLETKMLNFPKKLYHGYVGKYPMIKYNVPQTADTKHGLTSHTDKNIVTILYLKGVEGFKVKTKDGDWIPLKPSPDSFIVMIGDFLHVWTNGTLSMQVLMSGNDARYSVGLFSISNTRYVIKAPDELVDNDHPLLFKPYDHVEFINFLHTETGQSSESALKMYYSV